MDKYLAFLQVFQQHFTWKFHKISLLSQFEGSEMTMSQTKVA